MKKSETQITMSMSVDRSIEGQYIKIMSGKTKMFGKVLAVTAPLLLPYNGILAGNGFGSVCGYSANVRQVIQSVR